jgi:6,7-dimethyl-8-ribityllumazine synthase
MHQRPQPSSSSPLRIAIVAASWHPDIVENATRAAQTELQRVSPEVQISHFQVPGAFEIPLHAQRLAQSQKFDAVIACALVVNGGIYRHDFVSATVVDALMQVQLTTNVPVFSAVLTPLNFHEHDEHRQFFRDHFVKKGTEVAQACLQTLAGLRALAA